MTTVSSKKWTFSKPNVKSVVLERTNDQFVLDCQLITNSKYNKFTYAHLALPVLICIISGIPISYSNSNTPNFHIGIAMESTLGQQDIDSRRDNFKDYMEQFKIWFITRKYIKDDKFMAHFLTFISKEANKLPKNRALPDNLISLSYESPKELLLSHVQCASLECREIKVS